MVPYPTFDKEKGEFVLVPTLMELVNERTIAIRQKLMTKYEIDMPYYVPHFNTPKFKKYNGNKLLDLFRNDFEENVYVNNKKNLNNNFYEMIKSRGGAI